MPRSAPRHRCRCRDGNLPSGPPQADNLPQANPGHSRPGTSLDRLLAQTIACFVCGRQIAVPTTILRHVPRQAPGLPALYALAPTARKNLPYRPVRDYRGGGPPQGGGGVMPRSAPRHRCRCRDGNLPSGPPQADNLPEANPTALRRGTWPDRLLTQTMTCSAWADAQCASLRRCTEVRRAPPYPALRATSA